MGKGRKTSAGKGFDQPCIRHLEGDIGFRICTNDHDCSSCGFEQNLVDHYRVHAVVQPVQSLKVEGFDVPGGYYFHSGHTWARVEEGMTVRIGLDDFALKVLGPFDRIRVPLVGKQVKQSRRDIALYRGGNSAKVRSPVSGVATALNQELLEDARPAAENPYTDGWLMTVHSTSLRSDLKNLMIDRETEAFLAGEASALFDIIEEVTGPMAVDGGAISGNLLERLPELGWDRLAGLVFGS